MDDEGTKNADETSPCGRCDGLNPLDAGGIEFRDKIVCITC